MRVRMHWSAYRTQIAVVALAAMATFLVFGMTTPGTSGGRTEPSPQHRTVTVTGLGMAFVPALGGGLPRSGAPSVVASVHPQSPAPTPPAVGPSDTTPIITPSTIAPIGALDPDAFAPGSCVAFPPTQGDRHLTVFLDAGHGGKDPGGNGYTVSGHGVTEAWVNLRVEMDAMRLLTQQGYRVVVSRAGPWLVHRVGPGDMEGGALVPHAVRADIAARTICANLGKASLLVGIYMNAGYWGVGGSVTTYCASRPFSAESRRFAVLLQRDVLGALNAHKYGIPNDGVLDDNQMGSSSGAAADSYGHLMLLGPAKRGYFSTPSEMPGALIEPLFLTDPFEASLASTTRGQTLIAAGITRAANDYFAGPVAP